jgi:hypothetical protein
MQNRFISSKILSSFIGCRGIPLEQTLTRLPARQAVWAASSYWGTRNRQPPRLTTSLDASESQSAAYIQSPHKVKAPRIVKSWSPYGVVRQTVFAFAFGIQTAQIIKSFAQWLGLAADDFWYPSMRRPSNPTAARGVPALLVLTAQLGSEPKSVKNGWLAHRHCPELGSDPDCASYQNL